MSFLSPNQVREDAPPPIAIVGMAMRLPGGVQSAAEFWQMLSSGQDGRCVIPESRYNEDGFYSEAAMHSVRTRHGYFVQQDLETVDTSLFDMEGLQPSRMDPQQKLLLQVVWDCLENGGQVKWRGKSIGCFVGTFGGDWEELETKDTQNAHNFHLIGRGKFALANVVSYEFNFKGPSMTLETGCSSSLVALNQACQALLMGDCSSAIVAGTNLIFSPTIGMHGATLSVFSPSGISKSFDASADGYGRGEAINAILIKSLDDALRDGDPIRAVIRSTMVNCDGRSPGITSPSAEAQERLILAAYKKASISDISQTAFVECHGTGTLAGDPIECAAVAKVFTKGVHIGSVKPNVGHSEGASGLTSLIKAVLCLENRQIPPNVHFHHPNPRIPWQENRLVVPKKLTNWPKNRKERVSISNFGIGGTNAHVILDSFSSLRSPEPHKGELDHLGSVLLVISAGSHASLLRREKSVSSYMKLHPCQLDDLAYTLGARREHLSHRGFFIKLRDMELGSTDLRHSVVGTPPELTFVFTGQGAQWAGMGVDLMARFHSFREEIHALDQVLRRLENPPSWGLEDALFSGAADRINMPLLSQTVCCALQIALVNVLGRWGVKPSSVIGHSSGEIAAAYAAGAITAESAIALSYYRGLLVEEFGQVGAMAAIGMGRVQVECYLQQTVVIACENSPNSVTLSGKPCQVEDVLCRIKSDHPGVPCRMLRVNRAYHSRQFNPSIDHAQKRKFNEANTWVESMAPVAKVYMERIRPYLEVQKVMIPMHSSLTGKPVTDPQKLDAKYWSQNLTSPVLFLDATESIMNAAHEKCFFLEIGPHSALAGPLRETFKGIGKDTKDISYASCLVRGEDQESSLLRAAGELFLAGLSIDPGAIMSHGKVIVDLDPYPWECGKVNWRETRLTREWRLRKHGHHELLGSRVLESTQLEPSWRNMLHIDDVSWLSDHRIAGSTVFPCAGYIVMAGEAIRQITGCNKYRLRDLHINKALTLDENEKAEIVSNFRQTGPNHEQGSGWYEFSISSFRRGSWVKHCTGQGQGTSSSPTARDIRGLPRAITSSTWYSSLKRCGLEYGPRFSQLQQISAHPIHLLATASLETDGDGVAVDAPTLDQCLQLVLVAMCNGLSRKCHSAGMPIYIREVFAGKTGPILFLEATAVGSSLGETSGSAIANRGGEVAVKIEGVEFIGLEDGFASHEDQKLVSHLTWAPDVDALPPGQLLSPIPERLNVTHNDNLRQKFFQMCIIETARRVASLKPTSEYIRKYQNWVTAKSALILGSQNPVTTLSNVPRQDWPDILAEIYQEIKVTMPLSVSFAELALVVLENCTDIVEGKCSPLGLLMANEGLTRLYNTGAHRNYENFLKFLGHSRPDLNIVEVGAGTGATTARVLQCLDPHKADRRYSRYLFTDISSSFFEPAKDRFKAYDAIDFAVLDISQPPTEQGITAESFDLVIASNVFHATKSIEGTLQNVKSILKPGGRVLIEEICSDSLPIEYIMGVLPGWWMGGHDNRANAPYISVERWKQELLKAGFVGIYAAVDEPEIYMTSIVASLPPPRPIEKRIVNILCHSQKIPWITGFAQRMNEAGFVVRWHTLAEVPPVNEDVISFLDVEKPFLYSIARTQFAQLQQYVSSCASTRILWVTRASQIHCPDPRYGLILGFARTMRAEYQMDFATVEMEEFDRSGENALVDIYLKFHQQRDQTDTTLDQEYAIREGLPHIPRYSWSHLSQSLLEDATPHAPKTLTIEQPGMLESLRWIGHKLPSLKQDEVEIDVKFVGLNFRDLMVGLGMLPAKGELGLEGSGVVRRVGSEVKHLQTAERVIFLATPAFSTRIIVPAALVVAIPTDLSLEQAATVGCAYITAAYCLMNVGRLQKGQTVLIHSAAGGVGIASIMLCQMLGVEVFATVGNLEKAQYLTKRFGIPKEKIFNSRTASFAAKLLKKTQGQGVDLVLNSLAGDLLLASWDCVAEGGMMVEIGKRDLMGHAMLPMDKFLANRSFVGVDILTLARSRPNLVQGCLKRISDLLAQSSIDAIRPMHTFAASQITQAFKYMQEGKHMGKIIVQIPEDTASLQASKATGHISFCSDAAYLLVGGLGGLGCTVAQWMVEHGARHLVFLSRSAKTGTAGSRLVPDLALQGCHALLIDGDVSHLADVERAVAASSRPIKGVLHMAMVMQDSPFFSMSHGQWTEALQPKVEGAWNLHSALQSNRLDFFVMFSSVAAAAGSAGQANYTAANTFLGAFARYRQSLGLPASVLDIGWMVDVGYVSQRPDLLDTMRSKGYLPVQESQLLTALQLLLSPPQMVDGVPSFLLGQTHLSLGLGLSGGRTLSQARYKDARYRHAPSVRAGSRPEIRSQESSAIDCLFRALEVNQEVLELPSTKDLLIQEIALLIGPYTAAVKSQNASAMAEIVVDSLVAVEARAWLKRHLGVELGLVDIATAGTVQGIVSLTMDALIAKFALS